MKSALHFFPQDKSSIRVKNFKNEMIILHTSKIFCLKKLIFLLDEYSIENLNTKLNQYLITEKEYVTLKEFSDFSSINNQLLAKILIEEMLDEGMLALDESDLELRYYPNKILSFKFK
jgi:hypothetical protein